MIYNSFLFWGGILAHRSKLASGYESTLQVHVSRDTTHENDIKELIVESFDNV